MDATEVKLSCSLRWLSGMLSQTQYNDKERIEHLLLAPFHEGALREDIVLALTTPDFYTSIYNAISPNEQAKEATFWPLIHSLARKGIYVMEEEGDAVNHAVLAQRNPFKKGSHLAMIDALMSLYISTVVSVSKMVKTVKRFSTFNASQDLPSGTDGCLKLWLNKISQCICERHKNEMDALTQDSDARQRRRHKLKLMNTVQPMIRPVEDLCSDIADGQCLATLLLHYTPDKVIWTDFHFNEHALTKDQARRNLLKVREVCTSFLPPPGFHIHPTEILQCSQTSVLKSNVQALLSLLYHCLEYKQCLTTSTSDLQQKQNNTVSAPFIKNPAPPSILAKKRLAVHSFSTNDLYASSSRALKSRGGAPNGNSSSNNNSNSFQSLSSYSTSALIDRRNQEQHNTLPPLHQHHHQHPAGLGSLHSSSSSSTVFKPPIRSTVTDSQAAALASFKKPPLGKGPHSQSSPAMRISVSDVPTSLKNPKIARQQISASTDNLFIREKMLTERLQRAATSGALSLPQRYTGINSSGNSSEASNGSSSSSLGADVSGNCTTATNSLRNGHNIVESDREYTDGQAPKHASSTCRSDDDHLKLLSHVYPLHIGSSSKSTAQSAELQIDSNSALKLGIELKREELETRNSFTLNKQHTYASASAAGLPIINGSSETEAVDGETTPLSPKDTSYEDTKGQEERPSSDSSSGSAHTVVHLTIYSDKNIHVHHEKLSSVPPSVLELRRQLHSKMSERRTRQAIMDKQGLIEKQKFGQKVYLAAMQKSREPTIEMSPMPVQNVKQSPVKKKPQTKVFSPRKLVSYNTATTATTTGGDSKEKRMTTLPSQQTGNKTASLTQFEFLEAQVKASEELAISSTAKKPSSKPRGHPLGTIPLSPIAPYKMNESTETSDDTQSQSQKGDEAKHDTVNDVKEDVGSEHNNPWGQQQQLHLKQPTLNPVSQEELRKKREQLVKTRLEEREKARRIAVEQRRKETKERNAQQVVTNPPIPENKETIHFVLSSHQLSQASAPSSAPTSPARTTSETPSSRQSNDYLTHNGPECYIKPQTKSNKKIIRNALCHVCLAGDVNLTTKQRALEELETSTANHVMILFRDTIGFKFRALYWYSPDTDHVTKIFGSGPKVIKQQMVSHFYKYNSGLKEFKEIRSRAFSISFDAFTMKNEFWTNRKQVNNPLGKRTSSTGAL